MGVIFESLWARAFLRPKLQRRQRNEVKGGKYRYRKSSASTNKASAALGATWMLNKETCSSLWTLNSDCSGIGGVVPLLRSIAIAMRARKAIWVELVSHLAGVEEGRVVGR